MDPPPDSVCCICLEEGPEEGAESDMRWRRLPCSHSFHEECAIEWLRRARGCPVCRMDIHTAYLQREQDVATQYSRHPAPQASGNDADHRVAVTPEVSGNPAES